MAKKPEETFVMPETLGACADAYFKTRSDRLSMDKEVAKLKARESEIEGHILRNLPQGDTGVAGKIARASIRTKIVAQVHDWDAFWKYVFKTKDPALLQRRVSEPAIKERWENKKDVPGVQAVSLIGISVVKV